MVPYFIITTFQRVCLVSLCNLYKTGDLGVALTTLLHKAGVSHAEILAASPANLRFL